MPYTDSISFGRSIPTFITDQFPAVAAPAASIVPTEVLGDVFPAALTFGAMIAFNAYNMHILVCTLITNNAASLIDKLHKESLFNPFEIENATLNIIKKIVSALLQGKALKIDATWVNKNFDKVDNADQIAKVIQAWLDNINADISKRKQFYITLLNSTVTDSVRSSAPHRIASGLTTVACFFQKLTVKPEVRSIIKRLLHGKSD